MEKGESFVGCVRQLKFKLTGLLVIAIRCSQREKTDTNDSSRNDFNYDRLSVSDQSGCVQYGVM